MDQESHVCNGAATGKIFLVIFIVSVRWAQIICLVLEKAHYCQWASWNFYGIYTNIYVCI